MGRESISSRAFSAQLFLLRLTWAGDPGFYSARLRLFVSRYFLTKRLGNMLVNDQPLPFAFLPDGRMAAIELDRSAVLLFR